MCAQLDIKPGDVLELEVEDERLTMRKTSKKKLSDFRGEFNVEGAPNLDWREIRDIAWREQTRRLVPIGLEHDASDPEEDR